MSVAGRKLASTLSRPGSCPITINWVREVKVMTQLLRPLIGATRRALALAIATSSALLGAPLFVSSAGAASPPNFITFESGQVRPLAKSPDGSTLFAVNTPNGTLEAYQIGVGALTQTAHVPVGLEPVAVAARSNTEVWVVNHMSDSISIVSLVGTPHVVRTLLVGDEPRDIVFAGHSGLAFITTAHRGQQRTDPSIANVPGDANRHDGLGRRTHALRGRFRLQQDRCARHRRAGEQQ